MRKITCYFLKVTYIYSIYCFNICSHISCNSYGLNVFPVSNMTTWPIGYGWSLGTTEFSRGHKHQGQQAADQLCASLYLFFALFLHTSITFFVNYNSLCRKIFHVVTSKTTCWEIKRIFNNLHERWGMNDQMKVFPVSYWLFYEGW